MSTAISLKLEAESGDVERKLAEFYFQESTLTPRQFFESFVNVLPGEWTVCCLNLTNNNTELFVTRLRAKEAPLILRSRPVPIPDILAEFDDIMATNKQTTSSACTKACNTKEEKQAWWRKRDSLDERLEELLQEIEDTLLEGLTAAFEENTPAVGMVSHTILILDKSLQALPFESIPLLRSRSVSRMPSLPFLRDRLVALREVASPITVVPPKVPVKEPVPSKQALTRVPSKKGKEPATRKQAAATPAPAPAPTPFHSSGLNLTVDCRKSFYVLNPSKDLLSTQKAFEATFKGEKSWKGIVAREPTQEEFVNGLTQHDLFM